MRWVLGTRRGSFSVLRGRVSAIPKSRLEAFSDGVIAIIITIMVLELKAPHGADFAALRSLLPAFLSYVMSFIYLGIYWNNHHHLLHATKQINGGIMWAAGRGRRSCMDGSC